MFVPKVIPPFDTATRRDPLPMIRLPERSEWANYSELKKEIERLDLPAADYEQRIRELCSALGL